MKSPLTVSMLLLGSVALAQAMLAPMDFSRYQVIIDRKPFGEPPPPPPVVQPPPPPVAPAPPPAPPFTQTMKLTGIVLTPDGYKAGFVDAMGNKRYWMKQGEVDREIELVKVDYESEKILLRKGAEEQWLLMQQPKSSNTPPARAVASGGMAPIPFAARTPSAVAGAFRPPPVVSRIPSRFRGLTKAGYDAIRSSLPPPVPPHVALAAAAATNAAASTGAPAPQTTPEDMMKKLQDYNLDLIRAGGQKGPALPIPLTPEQDAQLVREGVLPAQ